MAKTKKRTKKLYISTFTPLEDVTRVLEECSVDFVLNERAKARTEGKVHLFTDVNVLAGCMNYVFHPPVLISDIVTYNHLRFFTWCLPLDFKLMFKGFAIRVDLKRDRLCDVVNKQFSSHGDLPFTGRNGDKNIRTRFTQLLFDFLKTIPVFIREPFMVALATAIESTDYKGLNNFIMNNRLVTNLNYVKMKEFVAYLTDMQTIISSMYVLEPSELQERFNKNELRELSKVKFILTAYGSKKLKSFLDHENTVNFRS